MTILVECRMFSISAHYKWSKRNGLINELHFCNNFCWLFNFFNYLPDDGLESSDDDEVDDFFSLLPSRLGIFVAAVFVFLVPTLLVIVKSFWESVISFLTTDLSSRIGSVDSTSTFCWHSLLLSTAVMTAFVVSFDVVPTKSMFNLTSVLGASSPPTGGTLEQIQMNDLTFKWFLCLIAFPQCWKKRSFYIYKTWQITNFHS